MLDTDSDLFHSLCKAGLNATKVEALICLNLMGGPWQGSGNLGKLAGALEQFMTMQTPEHPLFQSCYDFLSDSKHGNDRPWNFGSHEHQADVWHWVKTADVFQKKYETVKLSRWHNFTAKAARLTRFAGPLFFAIMVYSFSEQWYKSIYDTPLGGRSFTSLMDQASGQIW